MLRLAVVVVKKPNVSEPLHWIKAYTNFLWHALNRVLEFSHVAFGHDSFLVKVTVNLRGCSWQKKKITALSQIQPLQIIYQCKGFRTFYSIKIVLLQVFIFVRRAQPKSAKRPTSLWANLSGFKLYRINKTTAWYHLQSINYQNSVGVFPYCHWLLCNFPVKFDDQKFSDTCYDRRRPLQIPHTVFMFDAWGVFGPNLRAIRQIFIPYKFV